MRRASAAATSSAGGIKNQYFLSEPIGYEQGIALRAQRLLRPLVQLFSIWGFELNFFVAGQKCPDLFQTQVFAVLHAD